MFVVQQNTGGCLFRSSRFLKPSLKIDLKYSIDLQICTTILLKHEGKKRERMREKKQQTSFLSRNHFCITFQTRQHGQGFVTGSVNLPLSLLSSKLRRVFISGCKEKQQQLNFIPFFVFYCGINLGIQNYGN